MTDAPLLDAATSDPQAMGWMEGLPPPSDKRIRWADAGHMRFPTTRRAFSHMREFLPTANVSCGRGPVWELPRAERGDLGAVTFAPLGGKAELSWDQALAANFTDAIVVLHRGTIVYERYLGAMRPELTHIAFSMTKSFVGTIAEMLIDEGKLDPAAPVGSLIPELAQSGFGNATLRQLMDMTTGINFSEEYTDPASGIGAFSFALGLTPRPEGYAGPTDVYAFMPGIAKAGEHGARFTYRTVNTEVLGWIVARTEGQRLDRVLSQRIWQPLGMEADADFLIDGTGMPFAGGGLNPGLRDLARFGEAMRLGGMANGQQVIPRAVIESIGRGGRTEDFAQAGYAMLPGWSYRSQWWLSHNDHGAFSARGIHGQALWVDPAAEMVIARFASHPTAGNFGNDPTSLPGFAALGVHLMR